MFITDGALETTLIYRHHLDLPEFAAFVLLEIGATSASAPFNGTPRSPAPTGAGFIAESPTWRANPDWGRKLGYDADRLAAIDRAAVVPLADLRARSRAETPTPTSSAGASGRATTAMTPNLRMTAPEAERDNTQIQTFAGTPGNSALTITYVDEAVVLCAPRSAPACPSSSPSPWRPTAASGPTIEDAVLRVDAATECGPVYYMINCAHPSHFSAPLEAGRRWPLRIRGIRANASRRSHAEVNTATTLAGGDPVELAVKYRRLVAAPAHDPGAAAAPITGTSRPSPRCAPTCLSRFAPAAAADRRHRYAR